jgi:hypothetical protein
MAIYLITPLAHNVDKMDVVVSQAISERDRYKLQGQAGWLVSYPGTTVELSNQLGVTGQPENVLPSLTSVLITSIGAYYGRGSAEMWEWLKTRMEAAA